MKILCISGSSRRDSSNSKLLDQLPLHFPSHLFQQYPEVNQLPLFNAAKDNHPWTEAVLNWRMAVKKSDALIISTPEYLHNLPATIKNALEWLTSSGELMHKAVLPITFTPHPPRGERAMQSLTWSLQALDARIVGQLDLYQTDFTFESEPVIIKEEAMVLLKTGIDLLVGTEK